MPKSNGDAFPAHGNHHGKTAGVKIDLPAIVGLQGKKCRLVAMRAAPEVATARRSERTHSRRLAHCANQFEARASEREATRRHLPYPLGSRDQFRAWKQSLKLSEALNRRSNEHHMQALVLAGVIAHQLGMKIAQRIGSQLGRARLSDKKLYDLLAVRLIKARNLIEVMGFDSDPRHVERDKRTRKHPVESGILVLT